MRELCEDCKEPIDKPREAWLEYRGFARPKSQRGENSGSSLTFRVPTGRVLCGKCALDREAGVNHQQASLI